MPQVDFGSLYKFVASIGLVLIVASIALPWILLQSTDVLLISEKSIAGLPESAGDAIERRQVLVTWAQDHLPLPIFLGLALLGLLLLGWALFKWAPSQERSDANEQIALQKNEVEFRKLSSDEVDQKLEEEVAETNAAPLDEATLPPAEIETPADVRQEVVEDPRERSNRLIAQLRATEHQVVRLFQEAFEGSFKVEREVKITSGAARGRLLDILLDPDGDSGAQLGIEIKRFGSHVMLDRLSFFLMQAAMATQDLSSGTVFTGARGRPRQARASGVLVLVLESEHFATNAFRINRHVPVINSVLKRPIGVILITPERLDGVRPGELRDAVASVWAEPDQVVILQ